MKTKGTVLTVEPNDEKSVKVTYIVPDKPNKRRVLTKAALAKAIQDSDDFIHAMHFGIKGMGISMKVDKKGKASSPSLYKQ